MKYVFVILLLFSALQSKAQTLVLDSIAGLPNEVVESSGLIFFDGKLISHTDSGGENALYELDTNTAQVLRKIYITNSINRDWEDITQDENHIYIADIGNNTGNRTDLKILKITKSDFLLEDSVEAAFIDFSYEDQVDFTSSNQSTNFDAEAIISFEDSLYIFSKNWGNEETNVYKLAKDTGTFVAKKIANYNTEGMVTGADYNPNTNSIFLIGYRKIGLPFAVSLKDFQTNNFFDGVFNRYDVQLKGSVQVEAICSSSDNKYFVSSENFYSLKASLLTFKTENTLIQNIAHFSTRIENIASPNPTKNKVCLTLDFEKANLYNSTGQFLKTISKNCFDLSNKKNGLYFLQLFYKNRQTQVIKLVKD